MKNSVFPFMVALKYVICMPIAIGIASSIHVSAQGNSPITSDVLEEKLENLPLLFRQNMGQWDEKILYSGSSSSANVYFMKNELSFGFARAVKNEEEDGEPILAAGKSASQLKAFASRKFNNSPKATAYEYLVWNVRFQGANTNSSLAARGKADSRTNYFIGNDTRKHCVNVPDYRIITYQNIYNNIDLKYYGNSNRLKYDFVLKPHAKVEDIKMNYSGIEKMRISKEGKLLLSTAWGEMKEDKPFTYQLVNGKRIEIKSTYVLLNDSTIGFKMLEEYAKDRELIIDPIVLDWATFTGGTGVNTGNISKMALDASGNIYAVGTYGASFPTTAGSYDNTFNGSNDVIVFKMNPTGTALVYATYLGGSQWDTGTNLYVNTAGEVYVTGQTSSFNWPTTAGAYNVSSNGGGDIFITKLNAAGSALVFSTFLGGSGADMGADITLDPGNNVYVTGNTSSANFPTSAGAFQTVLKGYSDMILTKLNPAGNALVYSTLIGSSKSEYGVGVGVNAAGEATIGGNTDSLDFPTTAGAYDQTFNDAPNVYNSKGDMAVVKFNASGTGLIYSTFFGGNTADNMQGFYLSTNDEPFLCGVILFSNTFPVTPGVVGPATANGTFDSFVARLNATGSGLIYSTFLGNADPSSDEARDIYVNSCDEAYITGDGGSYTTFPVTTSSCATCTGGEDVYACKLNPTATAYLWSTFVGSSGWDVCQAIGVNVGSTTEEVAIGFSSDTTGFPTTPGTFQAIKPGNGNSTQPGIVKFSGSISASGTANAGPDVTICMGANVTLTANAGGTSYLWNPSGQTTSSISVSPTSTSTYTLTITGSCGTAMDSVKVTVGSSINAAIAGNTSVCSGQNTTLTASGGGNYLWNTGATTAIVTITATSSATYSVIVSSGLCPDDTVAVSLTVNNPPSASITGNTALCNGQSSTLTASGGGTYSWSNGSTATALVVSPTSNIAYTVTVSIGGCSASATQSISVSPLITVTASSTQTGCTVNNGTATANVGGGTSPFTYSWSNGQLSSTSTGLSIGNYTVTITDAGGCTKSQTVSVTSSSNLNVTATSTPTGCSAPSGTASAAGSAGTTPYSYSWSSGQTTQNVSGLAAGNYTVTITDAGGCTKSQTVSVTSSSNLSVTATSTPTGCSAPSGTASVAGSAGTAPYSYSWSSGQTTQNVSGLAAGTYTVTIIDANGCTKTATTTITAAPGPVATASAAATLVSVGGNTSLSSTGGGTYMWSPATGLSCTTCPNPVATPAQTTEYCVIVTDANGCTDSACVTVAVDVPCGAIYLPNAFSPNSDMENDEECVYGNCIDTLHLIIYNRWGEIVFETNDKTQCWDGKYKGKPEAAAVFSYYLQATMLDGKNVSLKGNVSLVR